jgi:hypothetical protein
VLVNRLPLGPSPTTREIYAALDHGKPPLRLLRETTVMAAKIFNHFVNFRLNSPRPIDRA